LFDLIRVAFAERRKTMRNALIRFGVTPVRAEAVLRRCGIDPAARPETLELEAFGRLVQMVDEPPSG
jgi:16S rRNA (adenine1518-N6/adenine1519-N6)-dimethyltransferase